MSETIAAPTDSELQQSLLFLLPEGPAWNKEPGSAYQLIAKGLSNQMQLAAQDIIDVAAELYPPTTDELLGDWESSTGLPDPCQPVGASQQDFRNQVVARLTQTGSQSPAAYIAYAASLGYTITIQQWAGLKSGAAKAGQRGPAPTPKVIYNWTVSVSDVSSAPVLECEFQSLNLAHMGLWFLYPDAAAAPNLILDSEGEPVLDSQDDPIEDSGSSLE